MSGITEGTEIAINRPPHDTSKPSHFVVGEDADGYLRICPIGRDPSESIYRGPNARPGSIVTRIPKAEVVTF